MAISRRTFLHGSMAALTLPYLGAHRQRELNAATLAPFVDPLPLPPCAQPLGHRADPAAAGGQLPYYRMEMREFFTRLHRDLPPTRLWGFDGKFPGPTLEARGGEALLVEWVNRLPTHHFLPVDRGLEGAGAGMPEVRAVAHVHGARVPPDSDGYPEHWLTSGQSALCRYPNRQDAAMLWYHDHAMGINRLNVYAGLFGAYFVRDAAEDALRLPAGEREIPLIICDRSLRADGQLNYPTSGTPDRPWVAEAFGDAILVNGKVWPYLEVTPRLYRFRLLNASNARFFDLSLSNQATFHLIGLDQGLLGAPLPVRHLTMAPGERADILIDFGGQGGARIALASQALPVLQFRVGTGNGGRTTLPARLRPLARLDEASAVMTRQLSLNEYEDERGNSSLMLLNATRWSAPVTETPRLDSTEIWSFVNLTDDSHPIHLHLVRFQILDRCRFDDFAFNTTGKLVLTGPRVPPDPSEAGWKDTVRADPKMVTRIIVRFEGYAGRYVWHCHILEHEDNEMMRPYEVLAGQ